MARIKCVLAYDGTNFSGYQIQPNNRTVAGELEKTVKKLHKGEDIRVHGSGRTDAGVHAKGQVIHFDTTLTLEAANWKRALNTMLPEDVYIKAVEQVPEAFHARFDAVAKEYRYIVETMPEPDIFNRNYVYHFPRKVDMEKIIRACRYLEGTHDFTTFSSSKTTAKGSRIRTLHHVSCEKRESTFVFTFRGDGFLYHMVRIMVGVLLDIGRGRWEPESIPELLSVKDRKAVGKTAPAQGLYLWEVKY